MFARVRRLPMVCLASLASIGCSVYIADCGEQVEKLNTREQVHATFGTPDKVGGDADQPYEEFRTHRKIAEPRVAGINFILGLTSFGLFEVVNFPATILQCVWTTAVGQTLRFEYTKSGEVQNWLINDTRPEDRARLP